VIPSIKLTIVAMTLFASLGAWFLGRSIWGRFGGWIVAALYSYAPYKMLNLYVRGDINEYMAMASLPWALWIILKTAQSEKPRSVSLAAICILSIPALTHYPSCVIQYPLIFCWILVLAPNALNRSKFLIQNAVSLCVALLLTSPFWVSAFLSRHLVQMEGMTQGFADYTKHFMTPGQWFSFYWNYGASVNGPGDAISFQLGNLALICIVISLFLLIPASLKNTLQARIIQIALITTGVSVFLTHSSSHWIWTKIPVLPLLQFPYRLLVIPAMMLSILGGAIGVVLTRLSKRYQSIFALLLVIAVSVSSLYMCKAAAYMNLTADDLQPEDIQLAAHTHCTGEYIPKPVGKRFPPPKPFTFSLEKIPEEGFSREQTEARLARWLENASDIEEWEGGSIPIGPEIVKPGQLDILEGNLHIRNKSGPVVNRKWEYESNGPGLLRLNQFYFEGWEATIDDTEVPLKPDPNTGLIHVNTKPGNHTLNIRYRNLPLARSLSLLSILTLILVLILRFIPMRKHEAQY